jgi:hypothetical protein
MASFSDITEVVQIAAVLAAIEVDTISKISTDRGMLMKNGLLVLHVLIVSCALLPWSQAHGEERGAVAVSAIDLDLMWQVGGVDEEFIIGFVQDAVVDDDGNFYLLDQQLARICVVDPSGYLRATIGGEGDGPGEFRNPGSVAWWDAEDLAVAQALPGRLKLISTDNMPGATVYYSRQGEIQVTGISRVERYSGGLLFQTMVNTSDGTNMVSRTKLVRCDTSGAEIQELFDHEMVQNADHFVMDERLQVPAWSNWICDEDGEVYWVSDRDKYEIRVARPSGQREIVVSRQEAPLVRTREEVEELRILFESGARAYFADVEAIVEKCHPVISRMLRGPTDQIWVSTSRNDLGKPDDVLIAGDAFDHDGKYLESFEMNLPNEMRGGELLVLDWPFVLARFQVDEEGGFHPGSDECSECVTVYAGFRAPDR